MILVNHCWITNTLTVRRFEAKPEQWQLRTNIFLPTHALVVTWLKPKIVLFFQSAKANGNK
jgi:hypothetical protein